MKKISYTLLIVYILLFVSCFKTENNIKENKEWVTMTYENRSDFLSTSIEKRSLAFASDLEFQLRNAIKNETNNPTTVKFTLSPSIYNGFANVVEADSGWVFVPFRCTAKNDFGIEKEIAGSVMYQYEPSTNSLAIKKWDLNQNN